MVWYWFIERKKKGGAILSQNVGFSFGDDRRLRVWCEDVALSIAFPTLFNLATFKDVKVTNVWDVPRLERGWVLVFFKIF